MCNLTFLGGYFKKEIDKIESILQRKGKWVDMRKVCSFTVSSSHQGSPGQSLLRDPPTRPTPQIKPLLDTANKSRWEPKYTFFQEYYVSAVKIQKRQITTNYFHFLSLIIQVGSVDTHQLTGGGDRFNLRSINFWEICGNSYLLPSNMIRVLCYMDIICSQRGWRK